MAKKRLKNKVLRGKELVSVPRACDTTVLRDRIDEINETIVAMESSIKCYRADLRELKEVKLALEKVLDENKKGVKETRRA